MVGPLPMDAFAALKPGAGAVTDALDMARAQDPEQAATVQNVLAQAQAALQAVAESCPLTPQAISLQTVSPAARALLAEVLGEGEVKAILRLACGGEIRLQESVMPGLWRILTPEDEWLEVADAPTILRQTIAALPLGVEAPASLPEHAMNVLPVLAELDDASRRFDAEGGEGVEVNLTLLPMTPVDMQVLDQQIGVGPASIISLGYGNCRVDACARRHLWTVRFYNTEDKQILNAVQAGDVPIAVRATQEDIADSAERLGELMQGIFA